MKILLIHNFSRDFNGEDSYVLSLKNLLKKRHEVIMYTKNNKDIPDNFLSKVSIAKNLMFNKKIKSELTDIIKKSKPDVAHIHNIFPLITSNVYKICKRSKLKIIQTIHNYRFMCPHSFLLRKDRVCEKCLHKRFFYPAVYNKCYNNDYIFSLIYSSASLFHTLLRSNDNIDKYIFPSEFTKNYYIKNINIKKIQTTILPHFVAKKKGKLSKYNLISPPYFLYVGRLSEEKGIIPLLNVFNSLRQYKLVVIGNGPLIEKVIKCSQNNNIVYKNFLPQREVYKYMQNAISTIIPSLWYEVLPMVMIESFANGTPVIVPKFGTFIKCISDHKTGIFYKQYDFEDLKKKIVFIAKNRKIAKSMHDKVTSEYWSKYTPESHLHNLTRIYQN